MMTVRSTAQVTAAVAMLVLLFTGTANASCLQDGSCVPPPGYQGEVTVRFSSNTPRDDYGRPIEVAAVPSAGANNSETLLVERSLDDLDELMRKRREIDATGNLVGTLAQGATVIIGAFFTLF